MFQENTYFCRDLKKTLAIISLNFRENLFLSKYVISTYQNGIYYFLDIFSEFFHIIAPHFLLHNFIRIVS